MPVVVLGTICLVVSLLLSVVNSITAPIIQKRQNAAANEALLVVLPDATTFDEITIDGSYPQ
jgi:Na+-translocating ferredoxin:NAD+ oxidoreductase RnfG subunit